MAGYIFPWVLLITAIDSDSIKIDERIGLLSVSLHYLKIIFDISQQPTELLLDHRGKDKRIRIFSNRLLVDAMNAIHSIIQIIISSPGIISLNRLSSNPLEHYFGLIRMRARYDHTFQKLLSDSKKIELFKMIKKEIGANISIASRIQSFGKIISVFEEIITDNLSPYQFTAYQIAYSMNIMYFHRIGELNLSITAKAGYNHQSSYVFGYFHDVLTSLHSYLDDNKGNKCISSKKLTLSGNHNIIKRIASKAFQFGAIQSITGEGINFVQKNITAKFNFTNIRNYLNKMKAQNE